MVKIVEYRSQLRLRIFQWNPMAIWRCGTTAVGYHQVIGEKVRLKSEIQRGFAFVFMEGDVFWRKSEENMIYGEWLH